MFIKLAKMGLKWLGCLFLIMLCTLCTMSSLTWFYLVPSTDTTYEDMSVDGVSKLLYKDNINEIRQTGGYHGSVNGYEGYDYTTKCGDTLYSPLPGAGVVTYNGRDGYIGQYDVRREQNTMIRIVGDSGEVTLFHGDYSLVSVGDMLIGGITPIGKNDSIGNSTGCHSHIVWKPNPNYVPNKYAEKGEIYHTGKQGNYGSILNDYDGVGLALSSYRPSEGGVNCDSDCSTMASGDKVATWIVNKSGIRAAACPQEWSFGTRLSVSGQTYECRDRGSYINCYKIGDYDPAYKKYAEQEYCWIDILGDSGVPYGTIVDEWLFVE